ncbi:MAG: choice-of-anchor Q domain-containing protein [Pseudomonadota bacterium]
MATFIVDTKADAVDDADGVTSLREAIALANEQAGADTIAFSATVFEGVETVIRLTQGELTILDEVTIDAGNSKLVISGDANGDDIRQSDESGLTDIITSREQGLLDDNSRVFNIQMGSGATTLVGLTITGGYVGTVDPPEFAIGGGILSRATLELRDSVITGNGTGGENASGGGIAILGDLTLRNTEVTHNVVTGFASAGGGIATADGYEADPQGVRIYDSVISSNGTQGELGRGGGISSRNDILLRDTVLAFNQTLGDDAEGGGLFVSAGSATVESVTLLGNRTIGTGSSGGAIYSTDGALTLVDSVLRLNETEGGAAEGGGIWAAEVALTNTVVDRNYTRGEEALGGGVFGFDEVIATNSQITNNRTMGDLAYGGGIAVGSGFARLTNTTVAGNFTDGDGAVGGGIYGGEVALYNSTISGNISGDARGGGIYAPGQIILSNSIVLGNEALLAEGDEIESDGETTFTGLNIVGGSGDVFDASVSANVINADATLVFEETGNDGGATFGIPANNGGPVETIALSDNHRNPALDASGGDNTAILDARGYFPVDFGFDAQFGDNVRDLGAFELQFQPFLVTTTADTVVADDGVLSLREAILLANFRNGPNTIIFDDTVFSGGEQSLIRLTQGQLEITDGLTIDGSTGVDILITGDANGDDITRDGTNITDLSAVEQIEDGGDEPTLNPGSGGRVTDRDMLDDNSRVFLIDADFDETVLTSLTITGGRVQTSKLEVPPPPDLNNPGIGGRIAEANSYYDGGGGGIYAQSSLTLDRVVIDGNSTFGDEAVGGGISATAGLTLINTTVRNNRTEGEYSDGGGVHFYIEDNGAPMLNPGAAGVIDGPKFSAYNATFSGNATLGDASSGGGIFADGEISFLNTTIAANEAAGRSSSGGGLFMSGGVSSELVNSTVTDNATSHASSNGGGVSLKGPLTIVNSILLGNDSPGSGDDLHLNPQSQSAATPEFKGANIVGAGYTPSDDQGIIQADPDQVFAQVVVNGETSGGVLADNGGPVETVALRGNADNPALDGSIGELLGQATNGEIVTATDARGFDAVDLEINGPDIGPARDIGAFELRPAGIIKVTTAQDVVDANDGVLSLREAIALANGISGTDTIIFDAAVFTGGDESLIRLTEGQLEIRDGVMIDGSTGVDIVISGDANGDDVTRDGTNITDVARSTLVVDEPPQVGAEGPLSAASHEDLLDDNSRVFLIEEGIAETTLNAITITGGRTTGASIDNKPPDLFPGTGGLILDEAGDDQPREDQAGGGILAKSDLRLTNATVAGNSTFGDESSGGGVASSSNLSLFGTTISNNLTQGRSADGGGIFLDSMRFAEHQIGDPIPTLIASNSTFSGNSTHSIGADGGAISVTGALNLVNSTLSGNSTNAFASDGGGVNLAIRSVSEISNTTITGNSVGFGARGGGVYAETSPGGVTQRGVLTISNSIVLGNDSPDEDESEISTSSSFLSSVLLDFTSGRPSIVGSEPTFENAGQVINADAAQVFDETAPNGEAIAGVLRDNGGLVQTVALRADLDNPALDAVLTDLQNDARGFEREVDVAPVTFGGIEGPTGDLGAYEIQSTRSEGADILVGDEPGDVLSGRGGNDLLIGRSDAHVFLGGSGNDTVSYQLEDVRVRADLDGRLSGLDGANGDTYLSIENLTGSDQDDVLFGNKAINLLKGGLAEDRLTGRQGADLLEGGAGADRLIGNADADTLTGGEGDDVFVFFNRSDSRAINRDRITDFEAGDRIDLSRVDADIEAAGNQTFAFVGQDAFDDAGQIRFFHAVAQNKTVVLANLDEDAASEMFIELDGLIDLTAADFIL